MTEEELYEEASKLLSDFQTLKEYTRYQALKKALQEDQDLQKLLSDRKRLQGDIKYLHGEKRAECIRICKKLQDEYDSSPLVINFKEAKEELLKILSVLTEASL